MAFSIAFLVIHLLQRVLFWDSSATLPQKVINLWSALTWVMMTRSWGDLFEASSAHVCWH
jgi:hypothetical protein